MSKALSTQALSAQVSTPRSRINTSEDQYNTKKILEEVLNLSDLFSFDIEDTFLDEGHSVMTGGCMMSTFNPGMDEDSQLCEVFWASCGINQSGMKACI